MLRNMNLKTNVFIQKTVSINGYRSAVQVRVVTDRGVLNFNSMIYYYHCR